jgi:predicted phage-related endonuclease
VRELRTLLRVPELPLHLSPRGEAGMKIVNVEQRSGAWFLARAGRLTGSRAQCVLMRGRGNEESLGRANYRRQLVLERLTGIPQEDRFSSAAMRRATAIEPRARALYAERTRQVVHTSGFLVHDELEAGTSPDGHVGAYEGVVELKSLRSLTHLGYLADRRLPAQYRSQVRHHLWITGAAWCDFVLYDDRLPGQLQIVRHRFTREELDIPGYEIAAVRFLEEVRQQTARVRAQVRSASTRDVMVCLVALEGEALNARLAPVRHQG